jgi:hypothetical protein
LNLNGISDKFVFAEPAVAFVREKKIIFLEVDESYRLPINIELALNGA